MAQNECIRTEDYAKIEAYDPKRVPVLEQYALVLEWDFEVVWKENGIQVIKLLVRQTYNWFILVMNNIWSFLYKIFPAMLKIDLERFHKLCNSMRRNVNLIISVIYFGYSEY